MGWKQQLAHNIRSLECLSPELAEAFETNTSFPLNLPKRLADKIHDTERDPIARQFLPSREESLIDSAFSEDPLEEARFRKTRKLLHKYPSRALLLTTNTCAMHCRFCFRRCFPYQKEQEGFNEEIQWLHHHPEIEELILSGGDPLSLPDSLLERLLYDLSHIPHIQTIRFHTRFPIGIPERINDSFLSCLRAFPRQQILVLHTNHPLELDENVCDAMHLLHEKGLLLLSQTVLLKGVNDSLTVLEALMKRIVQCRILPYYLHQLDRVQGASHFEVPHEEGKKLISALRQRLPGYAIPRYVQETAFESCKTPLT